MSNDDAQNVSITDDPIYYITAGFFALLTTVLPASLGQPRFLPILQTATLFIFVAVALHHRNVRGALKVMAIWLPIQFIVMVVMTRFFSMQLEAAIANGFEERAAITVWFFAGAPHPTALTTAPGAYITSLLVTLLGSLITAGISGIWSTVRLLNLAGYHTGILLTLVTNPTVGLLTIPYWTLLRAAAYGGLVILCAQPLLTYNWSPGYYWRNQKQLIVGSLALLGAAIILELILPGVFAQSPVN